MARFDLARASPLYDYWRSEQTDEEENKRLLMANHDSKAVFLFVQEPYKWEILFQSALRGIVNGDLVSITGMKVLMSTVKVNEQKKIIDHLSELRYIEGSILQKIQDAKYVNSGKKNKLKALVILFMIFTNPYGIVVRRDKNHIYEKTGALFNNIRQTIKGLI